MSSYQLAQRYNTQTVLWSIGDALYLALRPVAYLLAGLGFILGWLWQHKAGLGLMVKALALTALCGVGMAAAIALPLPLWLGVAVVAAFALITYPR